MRYNCRELVLLNIMVSNTIPNYYHWLHSDWGHPFMTSTRRVWDQAQVDACGWG